MQDIAPGRTIGGRYLLEERRHASADGIEVWRAVDQTLQAEARLTLVPHALPHADAVVDAARRAAGVQDHRLVQILDIGAVDGFSWIVEEHHAGARTLTDLVSQSPLDGEQARTMLGESASVLAVASNRGLHHLRLSPYSILITPAGAVKLSGLGTVFALEGEEEPPAERAELLDCFGLLALVYYSLTTRWPLPRAVPGIDPAPRVVGGVPAPSEIAAGVPADLDLLCRTTLNGQPGPRTPADLAADVAPWRPEIRLLDEAETTVLPTLEPPTLAPPDVAGPAATEPAATEPALAGPAITERALAGPAVEEPAVTESAPAEPALTEAAADDTPPAPESSTATSPKPSAPELSSPGSSEPGSSEPPPPAAAGEQPLTRAEKRSRSADAATTGADETVPPTQPVPHVTEPTAPEPASVASSTRTRPTAATAAIAAAEATAEKAKARLGTFARAAADKAALARDEAARRREKSQAAGTTSLAEFHPQPAPYEQPGPLLPFDVTEKPGAHTGFVLAVVAAVLVVAVTVSSIVVFRGFTAAPSAVTTAGATAGTTSEATPQATRASAPVIIRSGRTYDPFGDGSENDAYVPRAFDGDLSTRWVSEQYYSQPSWGGADNQGVGVVFRMPRDTRLSTVTLEFGRTPQTATVYVGNSPRDLSSATRVGAVEDASGSVTLPVTDAPAAEYVYVWFTKAVQEGGSWRVSLYEIRLES